MSEYLELPLASIEVGDDRARELDPAWVEGLAGSIREQGLLQPIVVRPLGDLWRLVAGHHRLEAVRSLGRETIMAVVSQAEDDDAARLAEVMENLGRAELIALDRCHHLYQLKQVWERMYPQARHGGDRKSSAIKSRNPALDSETPEIFGFARAHADKIGLGVTQIKQAVKIWTTLIPSVRRQLAGTALATKQTELKALSELDARKQVRVLDAILADDLPDVGNVAQALEHLAGTLPANPLEKRFQAVSRTIAALDDDTLDHVIAVHEDRILDSLRRRGRL